MPNKPTMRGEIREDSAAWGEYRTEHPAELSEEKAAREARNVAGETWLQTQCSVCFSVLDPVVVDRLSPRSGLNRNQKFVIRCPRCNARDPKGQSLGWALKIGTCGQEPVTIQEPRPVPDHVLKANQKPGSPAWFKPTVPDAPPLEALETAGMSSEAQATYNDRYKTGRGK